MTVSPRPFRFGVVVTPDGGPDRWTAAAHRVEELGYSTLLMPDGVQLLSPFPSLAVAAAATTTLRVGTYVLAAPLRTPAAAAWDAHTLTVLTAGRFDLGIGTGHGGVPQAAAQLGMPYGNGTERRQQVRDTVAHLRKLDGDARTPVLIAAAGPRALALGGQIADVVMLAAGWSASRADVAAMAEQVRAAAGERDVELGMNHFVVGDEVPAWTRRFLGAGAEELIAADSLTMLRGDTAAICDELRRRRDAFGTSYIAVNGAFLEQLAPVVERLTGT